jgi:acetyl esterase/lipase
VFTTQDPETLLRGVRARVLEENVATLSDLTECESPSTESPCYTETTDDEGEVDERGACRAASSDFTEIHGRIRLPMFQQGTLPYLGPEDGGNIELDDDGLPVVQSRREVCFAMSVPSDPPPDGGYPVIVYAHGTGGVFNGTMGSAGIAQDMATADTPAVIIGIDLPQHGERRGDSTESPEGLFYNFLNPRAARDNVLQGSADILGMVRWVAEGGLTAGQSPTNQAVPLNAARVALMGHSQGATHTALMTSYEPGAIGVVLSGVGGHLASSLLERRSPVDIGRVIPLGLMDPDKNFNLAAGNFNPALAILQTVFDAVDPINYAQHLYRNPTSEVPQGQHAFVSYGVGDTFSPEVTQLAYALAGRLPLVGEVHRLPSELLDGASLQNIGAPLSGNVQVGSTARTVGMRQFEPETMRDGMLLDGHFVATTPGEDGYADVIRFLSQTLAGEQPQIGP